MIIIKPLIFEKFPEIQAGVSTKVGNDKSPFGFNMSTSVGDDVNEVYTNREKFANYFGYKASDLAYQHQIHSVNVKIVENSGYQGEYDAMVTNKKGLPIVVSLADCTPILLYEPEKKVIAAVHSGWKGTQNSIIKNVLNVMAANFKCNIKQIFAYIGPSISEYVYEVGKEFENYFDKKYLLKKNNDKYLLNVKAKIYDDMLESGVEASQIQISNLCTFQNDYLHSYRRDKENSGRMYALMSISQ